LSDSGTIGESASTIYSTLVDLPNARATLDKTLSSLPAQPAAASQDGTSSNSTTPGTTSPGSGGSGTTPSSSGGAGQ
jgi:hypothetical protein